MKQSVAEFCGKDSYQFGDLSQELAKRTSEGVKNYTGKSDYKFGKPLMKIYASAIVGYLILIIMCCCNIPNIQMICQGDITKQALKNLSGKDDYQFGDVTKKFLGNVLKKGDKK